MLASAYIEVDRKLYFPISLELSFFQPSMLSSHLDGVGNRNAIVPDEKSGRGTTSISDKSPKLACAQVKIVESFAKAAVLVFA